MEAIESAYRARVDELDGWLALRTHDDNVELEAQLIALNGRLQGVRALVAGMRQQLEAERNAVSALEAAHRDLVQTCAVVTQQAALVFNRDDMDTMIAGAAPAAKAGKENARRPVDDGIPRIPLVRADEFEAIPKYMMKARLTVAKMNEAVEALSDVFGEKYRLMRVPPAKMKDAMRRRYQAYRAAETEATEGMWFVTEEDIKEANCAALKLDPTGRAILCMLRHLGRLQENRSKGFTRFIMLG